MENLLFLRLAVAAIFIYHAIPKLKEPKNMASGIGWTPNKVLALGLVEFVSGLGIAGGIAVKLSASLLIAVMLGAIYYKMSKWNVPFSAHDKTGWELDLLLLTANLTIFLRY
ncbi:MAG: DoxX family protein [Candidatus Yanofskybacteria bacterium]|nr:DoxX family protein [Candidatus Yanofskybacteria bacterium]